MLEINQMHCPFLIALVYGMAADGSAIRRCHNIRCDLAVKVHLVVTL